MIPNIFIKRLSICLRLQKKDFDVKFFPEGGALLTVAHQNIAFKAQGSDGFSTEIEGFLFDANGDTLTVFRSEHDGMGVFTLNPTIGNSYYVIAKSGDGISKRFDLPAVEEKGITLSMTHYKKEIRYEIQKTEATQWPQKLFLIGTYSRKADHPAASQCRQDFWKNERQFIQRRHHPFHADRPTGQRT